MKKPPKRARRRDPAFDRVHGEVEGKRVSAWDAVHAIVRRIPRGRVMTYGQIATLLGSRLSPRAVGWAMHGCPKDVPWQRVVNASGRCSTERLPDMPLGLQHALLKAEKVKFTRGGAIDLGACRWSPVGSLLHSKGAPPRSARSRAKAEVKAGVPRHTATRRRE
jgi:methylated-DNA-protein-cysteine methyltransferase-like protein